MRSGNTLHSLFLTPFTLNRSGIQIRVKSTVPVSVRLLRVEQKELTPQVPPRQGGVPAQACAVKLFLNLDIS